MNVEKSDLLLLNFLVDLCLGNFWDRIVVDNKEILNSNYSCVLYRKSLR